MITFYFFTVLQQSCSSNHGIHCLDVGYRYEGTSCAKPQKGGKTGRKSDKTEGLGLCQGWGLAKQWMKCVVAMNQIKSKRCMHDMPHTQRVSHIYILYPSVPILELFCNYLYFCDCL